MPNTRMATSRQFNRIQPTLSATANTTKQMPKAMKNTTLVLRLETCMPAIVGEISSGRHASKIRVMRMMRVKGKL
jgi:hypothetical protein